MTDTPPGPTVFNDRYELHRKLAQGGMANVYLARDLLLDRPVAVKVMFPEHARDEAFVERFRLTASFEGARQTTLDGVRVDWADGWGLVRASNTTPVLVMRFDADSSAAMARIQQAFRDNLLRLEPDLQLPF